MCGLKLKFGRIRYVLSDDATYHKAAVVTRTISNVQRVMSKHESVVQNVPAIKQATVNVTGEQTLPNISSKSDSPDSQMSTPYFKNSVLLTNP